MLHAKRDVRLLVQLSRQAVKPAVRSHKSTGSSPVVLRACGRWFLEDRVRKPVPQIVRK